MAAQETSRDWPSFESERNSRPQRKQLEQLRVSTGLVLIIDQFMLANEQFLSRLPKDADRFEEEEDSIRATARMYGGSVLRLSAGRWGVLRDAQEMYIALAPVGDGDLSQYEQSFDVTAVNEARGNSLEMDRVLVDTRCLVFLDLSLVGDQELISQYRDMRKRADDKGARDLLRERGAAVRYGFSRDGDELGVFRLGASGQIALWPIATNGNRQAAGNE